MPAADDQADARKDVAPGRHPGREDMGLDMVGADQRNFKGQGQHFGGADSDKQRSDKARGVMNDDAANAIDGHFGYSEGFVDNRKQTL